MKIISLLLIIFGRTTLATQRAVFAFVGLTITFGMIVTAHAVNSVEAVIVCMFSSICMILAASKLGMGMKQDLKDWVTPLFIGLIILVITGFVNALVLDASLLTNILSICLIALFSGFTVYDANQFVRERNCKFDCCEEGVFNIFVDLANIATSTLKLQT